MGLGVRAAGSSSHARRAAPPHPASGLRRPSAGPQVPSGRLARHSGYASRRRGPARKDNPRPRALAPTLGRPRGRLGHTLLGGLTASLANGEAAGGRAGSKSENWAEPSELDRKSEWEALTADRVQRRAHVCPLRSLRCLQNPFSPSQRADSQVWSVSPWGTPRPRSPLVYSVGTCIP